MQSGSSVVISHFKVWQATGKQKTISTLMKSFKKKRKRKNTFYQLRGCVRRPHTQLSVQVFAQYLGIMQLCWGSTGHKLVERSCAAGRYFFSTNTENESTFKGWGDCSATAICIECRIDCSTSFSMWVINEGRGWDVMINSIWGFLRLPGGWLGTCCRGRQKIHTYTLATI